MKRPRFSADVAVLLIFLLLLAVVSSQIAGTGGAANRSNIHRTVDSATPSGWKALWLLLSERGAQTVRLNMPPSQWPDDLDVVITGSEYERGGASVKWDRDQAEDALKWVDDNHRLLVFDDNETELSDRLELTLDMSGNADQNARLAIPDRTLLSLEPVSLPEESRITKLPDYGERILLVQNQIAGVRMLWGDGDVTWIASAGFCDNAHLARADNARFAVQLAERYAPKKGRKLRIGFDEFHQGNQSAPNLWTYVGRGGQLFAWQLAALAVLSAYTMGRRFGLPRPLPPVQRVSLEYVTSVADLYRRARATDSALETLLDRFRRELAATAGLAADASDNDLAVTAARALGGGDALEQQIVSLLAECRRRLAESAISAEPVKPGDTAEKPVRIKPGEMLALAQGIDALRKDWPLGRHD